MVFMPSAHVTLKSITFLKPKGELPYTGIHLEATLMEKGYYCVSGTTTTPLPGFPTPSIPLFNNTGTVF